MPKRYSRHCNECAKGYTGSSPQFCSRSCYVSSRWTYRTCQQCFNTFKARKVYLARGQMTYCSPKCGQLASRKHPIQEFNGIRYYLSTQGYMENSDLGLKMHREVWAHYRGPIPDDYVVHHINENKTDNRIENLRLVEWAEHTAEHSRERWRSGQKMGKTRIQAECREPTCDRPAKAKQLCTKHYQRMKAKERGKWL
jgi:hypothetical protein